MDLYFNNAYGDKIFPAYLSGQGSGVGIDLDNLTLVGNWQADTLPSGKYIVNYQTLIASSGQLQNQIDLNKEVVKSITSNYNFTGGTDSNYAADLSALSLPIGINEIWSADIYLVISGGNPGVKFKSSGPLSGDFVRNSIIGNTFMSTSFDSESIVGYNLGSKNYLSSSSVGVGILEINSYISNGPITGLFTPQLNIVVGGGAKTYTCLKGSTISAKRVLN